MLNSLNSSLNANIKNKRKFFSIRSSVQITNILRKLVQLGIVSCFLAVNRKGSWSTKVFLSKKALQKKKNL